MAIYKEYNHTIRITGENRNDEVINLEFQSYDKSVAKLVLDLYSENGLPINLTGASVHFLLVVDENQSIEILGTIEDLSAGKVSMEIPQQIKGYNGRVKCGVYIDFNDGSKIDVRNLVFDLEKSLIDNIDYTPIKGNLFQTFDLAMTEIKNYMNNVKQDTVSYADTQKSVMLAKTNEVKAYGDNQKTQIGQVLPDVQSKVSAINTELAKIDENMPDLFVAYADDLAGTGFSKTDNTKLYKGYGVKNSTNPTDYRWERNINIIPTGQNLIRNTNTNKLNIVWQMQTGGFMRSYYVDNGVVVTKLKRDNVAQSGWSVINIQGIMLNKLKPNTQYVMTMEIMSTGGEYLNFSLRHSNGSGTISNLATMFLVPNKFTKASLILTTTNPMEINDQIIYITEMDSSVGAEYHFKNISLKEISDNWSPAPEDTDLKINPINSILTTLSQENPSTTLGGTWTQLGNENKFNQTIYYWKRTN